MGLTVLAIVVITITLLPRWKRYRVRVTGISRVRSEMAHHQWPLLSPRTPVGGVSTPRTVPPAGPKQPDVSDPPTGDVRCRRRVVLGDPRTLSTTLSSGWRLR